MLPANVPVGAIFCGGSEASGIPVRHYGISSLPKRIEKTESVKYLQPLSLEMAYSKQATSKSLVRAIDRDKAFYFQCYSFTKRNHQVQTVRRGERGNQFCVLGGLSTESPYSAGNKHPFLVPRLLSREKLLGSTTPSKCSDSLVMTRGLFQFLDIQHA